MISPALTAPQVTAKGGSPLPLCIVRHLGRISLIVSCRASARLRRSACPEDVVQDVVVRALRERDTFTYRGELKFIHWIASITRNVLIDRERSVACRPPMSVIRAGGSSVPGPTASNIPGPTSSPSSIISTGERSERVREALHQLKRDQRDVICRLYFEGQSAAQCATQLGCSERTVSNRMARALHQLSVLLRGDQP